jgi:hypothetical protein
MSPRNVIGNGAVKNCGEAYTEWNCDAKGSDNFVHKSEHPSSIHLDIKIYGFLYSHCYENLKSRTVLYNK